MKRGFFVLLLVGSSLMGSLRLHAQAAPGQNPPPASHQNPPANPPKQESNPFPEDTANIPLMPSKDTPGSQPESYSGNDNTVDTRKLGLPGDDLDPVRSPDDASGDNDSATEATSSSSRSTLDKLLGDTNDNDQPTGKRHKGTAPPPEHKETSAEDIDVGKYYLDQKNWKAALSRFESAMVLAPDEPEVYWGLAESARHLGDFSKARGYYQKVAEYDPDSKHGKEAVKALKDPEIANAKATPPTASTASQQ